MEILFSLSIRLIVHWANVVCTQFLKLHFLGIIDILTILLNSERELEHVEIILKATKLNGMMMMLEHTRHGTIYA